MNPRAGGTLTLTGPHDGIDASLEDCTAALDELSPRMREVCTEHTREIRGELLDDGGVAPGAALEDARDVAAFEQFVTNRLTEYWFADLNARGSELDLGWGSFRSAVRLYTERAYLRAFDAYRAATDAFAAVERRRSEATDAFEEIETRLQRGDGSEQLAEDEAPLESLFADAADLVGAAADRMADAETAVVDVHAYYTIGECYREEYDLEPSAAFEYVSLEDDFEWFAEDLRHRRDRLTTRVEWLQRDFSKLRDRASDRLS